MHNTTISLIEKIGLGNPNKTYMRTKKDVKKKCRYRISSELENTVQEINHVTNVTKVLNKTTASNRVSRLEKDFSPRERVLGNVTVVMDA